MTSYQLSVISYQLCSYQLSVYSPLSVISDQLSVYSPPPPSQRSPIPASQIYPPCYNNTCTIFRDGFQENYNRKNLLFAKIGLCKPTPPGLAERLRQRTHNSRKAGSTPAPWIDKKTKICYRKGSLSKTNSPPMTG